ncbi:MAG: SMC family ATPase [Clostridia bacterium]|nr:SMC family ATPase [Clostridia bacterium]
MKPIYLEFCGINSFSEKTEIDFRALLSGGVFGIFGDTGSGKSTVLDCIHLALYGQIERSSGSDFIHYNLDQAYVIFDFEITTDGVRRAYRVKRERRRKNNVGKAQLYQYTDEGGLFALAEGTRDVNDALERIIGLSFADFKMCIALPQGDFAALVKATPGERIKLVSRLFDLERYGERLAKSISEKYYRAEESVNLVKAKMEQNEGGDEETIASKNQEMEAVRLRVKETAQALEEADAAYQKANELQKEKRAFEALEREICALREELPRMEELRRQIERLPNAKAVIREWEALQKNGKERAAAERDAALAENGARAAAQSLERMQADTEKADYDGTILKTSIDYEKVKNGQADLEAQGKAWAEYERCVKEFKRLGKENPFVDFDAIKAEKEREIETLGNDESLLDYLKKNAKDVLLVDAYGEFRGDLRAMSEKYPQTESDVALLLKKYTLTASGKTLDVGLLNAEFKEIEQKRKCLREELNALSVQKAAYEISEQKRAALAQQGKEAHERFNELQAKTAQLYGLGTPSELEDKIEKLKREKAASQERMERARKNASDYALEEQKQRAIVERCLREEKELTAALKKALSESGFRSAEEAISLLEQTNERTVSACKAFFEKYELAKNKYAEADKVKLEKFDEETYRTACERKANVSALHTDLCKRLAAAETEYNALLVLREKYRGFAEELKEKQKQKDLCDELRQLTRGNRFLGFIASEYLQEVCVSASKTLLSLTNGRYFLRYDEEFKVGDNLDGGNFRAVKTLSGGETFLVSLSLALSLSAAICNKSLRPIEFFFLDEGFGTLDEKLVDTVMNVLGKLSKNFAVGLISHVEELKHRIDNKILVTGATETRGSFVRIERF